MTDEPTITHAEAMDAGSMRETNHLDYILIRDNPIIRAGVFQYKGSQLPGGEPDRIYNVYRPMEELTRAETIESFIGLPIFDEHEMVGGKYARGAEERTAHGSILENIRAAGMDILAPIRIFSRTLKSLIDAGKKGLSLGYNCTFEKSVGVFNGIAYDYKQTNILGNHLALVLQGRNGTEVLDSNDVFDHFDLALDTGELKMADENDNKTDDKKVEAAAVDLASCHKFLTENAPMWKELQTLMGAAGAEGDTALDEDADKKDDDKAKAEDEDDKKDDEKEGKKEAMDANDIKALINSSIASERKTIRKSLMTDINATADLAKRLEPHVGTFACDSMDLSEVATYGADKLGLNAPKGQELTAVNAFLAGKASAGAGQTYAMDSALVNKPKAEGLLSKAIANANK